MKKMRIPGLAVLLLFVASTGFTQQKVGKIVQIVNDVDITSLSSGKKNVPSIGDEITLDHKIRTGKKSLLEIVLDDGTRLSVREVSVLNISSLKLAKKDAPTRIRLLTGKLRVSLKHIFKGDDKSLILKTPTAIAGVRGTDFGAIASPLETKFIVFDGKVEVASANTSILKSFVLREREETGIKKDQPPIQPRTVPGEVLKNWFDYYDISDDNRIIIRGTSEKGLLDRLLRKQDY